MLPPYSWWTWGIAEVGGRSHQVGFNLEFRVPARIYIYIYIYILFFSRIGAIFLLIGKDRDAIYGLYREQRGRKDLIGD